MTEQAMSEALEAIQAEAEKLLDLNPSPEAEKIIDRIIAIARYQHDVRTDAESGRVSPAITETEEERHRRKMMESDDPDIWTKLA